MKRPLQLGVSAGAVYGGPHSEYRYVLDRLWNPVLPAAVWIMLNPSTATESEDDPTVAAVQLFSRLWGYGSARVLNLFAIRSTCPWAMRRHPNPIGDRNDYHLEQAVLTADLLVCAWGNHGHHLGRGAAVLSRLFEMHAEPHALRITKLGHPAHPLYLKSDRIPQPIERPHA